MAMNFKYINNRYALIGGASIGVLLLLFRQKSETLQSGAYQTPKEIQLAQIKSDTELQSKLYDTQALALKVNAEKDVKIQTIAAQIKAATLANSSTIEGAKIAANVEILKNSSNERIMTAKTNAEQIVAKYVADSNLNATRDKNKTAIDVSKIAANVAINQSDNALKLGIKQSDNIADVQNNQTIANGIGGFFDNIFGSYIATNCYKYVCIEMPEQKETANNMLAVIKTMRDLNISTDIIGANLLAIYYDTKDEIVIKLNLMSEDETRTYCRENYQKLLICANEYIEGNLQNAVNIYTQIFIETLKIALSK